MKLLDWIWDLFRKPKQIKFTNKTEITGIEIGQLLKQYCQNLWLSDGVAVLINDIDMKAFLTKNLVNDRKYITEYHDCDDYSFELMGDISCVFPQGAFGMVWGNRASDGAPHAWNFYINENKEVKFIEPQNDSIFLPSLENIWIMII